MNWKSCSNKEFPKEKDQIIVKTEGNKLGYTHAYVYVREGEGLGGWFDEWRYATEQEIYEFGKIDCAYLKIKVPKPEDTIIEVEVGEIKLI